jgi:hypothetical protein
VSSPSASVGAATPLSRRSRSWGWSRPAWTIANHISQNATPKGPDISISNLVQTAATKVLQAFGMNEADAKKWAPIVAVIAGTVMTGGALAMDVADALRPGGGQHRADGGRQRGCGEVHGPSR